MKNYNKMLFVMILFIILYLIYLEKLCNIEILEENRIISNYDSDISESLYKFNKKDKIILKEFILSLTKENSKRKEKKKLYGLITNAALVSTGIVILDNMNFPNYIQYPIVGTLISILTPY
jgi:hypothetical protein